MEIFLFQTAERTYYIKNITGRRDILGTKSSNHRFRAQTNQTNMQNHNHISWITQHLRYFIYIYHFWTFVFN